MQMTNEEICREYRQAKNRQNQIRILADENLCSVDEIRKILIDGGALKPKPKKEVDSASLPASETVISCDTHLRFLVDYITIRVQEIEDVKKELKVIRDALNHICDD